jgi:uncharacterized membrane-anchored protein
LRVIQDNFEEGYVKEKNIKKWNGRRMHINSKKGKRSLIEERHSKCQKLTQKIEFHVF